MINQFVQVTGSGREQAAEILSTAQWQLQAALSRYFDETVTPYRSGGIPWGTPSNTPATPPNFGEALAAFSALSTAHQGCKLATSPLAQAPRQYLPMSPPNQPFSPPSKNLPLPLRRTEMQVVRVRHDSEVQGGGKVAVRGEEVKATNMREGER